MPDSIDPCDKEEMEPLRFPGRGVEGLEASVRQLIAESEQQARLLDSLSAAPDDSALPYASIAPGFAPGRPGPAAPEPRFILTLDGTAFEAELDALSDWVHDFLLPTYGAEVSTATPWCQQWAEHLEVVGWLHALWMAYQQHTDPEAGPSGPAVWHRDFLTHTMAAIRAPGGPLSACMTSLDRPSHRILPSPHGPAPTPGDEQLAASGVAA
ncbi:protein of unknown function [Actinacidiphila rubida]|uniref:DUF4913 domain-containing protein n=2 Tax=Actinacidiphila rubida TaxID=310780 RepID=A0A1H8S562_9ACTN|nr:DUF4913 domain-containing protein [Actinacidiphila rubida]SEO73800.1 protein of unknown function [Actinacidiphila rubida]